MGFCKNPLCHPVADRVPIWSDGWCAVPGCRCYRATSLTVSCIVTPLRTFSYVSFRGPVPESRWIDLRVRAPYVSPADCVLAASCASLGFIPAQAGIGAIQCERTRPHPNNHIFYYCGLKSADYEILKLPVQGGRHCPPGTLLFAP